MHSGLLLHMQRGLSVCEPYKNGCDETVITMFRKLSSRPDCHVIYVVYSPRRQKYSKNRQTGETDYTTIYTQLVSKCCYVISNFSKSNTGLQHKTAIIQYAQLHGDVVLRRTEDKLARYIQALRRRVRGLGRRTLIATCTNTHRARAVANNNDHAFTADQLCSIHVVP